jgi:tetratricopeptide (TPR) repeat protein
MYQPRLDDLPEAVPLRRVSPGWRVVAILGLAATGVLFVAALMLGVWVARLHEELDDYQSGAVTTAPPVWAPTAVAVKDPDDDPDPEPGLNAANNLPYPVKEDLRPETKRAPEDGPERPRQRFLKLSQEVWKSPRDHSPASIAVSPDGLRLAYFSGSDLVTGPFVNVQKFEIAGAGQANNKRGPDRVHQLVGFPTWSADSLNIYVASAGGRMYRFNCDNQQVEKLPFLGQLPAPVPTDPDRIVFVQYEAELKAEGAGSDRGSLVMGNLKTGETNTIKLEASATGWSTLAVSPDGKQVAALRSWSNLPRCGIVVIDLGKGSCKEAGPSLPGALGGPLSWTASGTELIYARFQDPAPADCYTDDGEAFNSNDLFQWDLQAGKETRLSRGGGFFSPTRSSDSELFFVERPGLLNWRAENGAWNRRLQLRRMALRSARKFAASQNEPPVRDSAAWTALFAKVCEEANLAGNVNDASLTGADMTRLAETFGRAYRAQFNEEPPASSVGLNRLQRELKQLRWEPADLARARLVVGAVQGEYLRQKHGARWQLVKGPLVKRVPVPAEPAADGPFGCALNPFQELAPGVGTDDEDSGGWSTIDHVLREAEGRPLVLTNDPAAARASIAKDADADLEAGRKLLKDGKGKEAEAVLVVMLDRPAHRDNLALLLQVCQLLHDAGRTAGIRRVVEERCSRAPYDARLFNYLGISLLDGDARQAINAFKKALRCDLNYGPAYLNLAQAYEKVGETANARAVLKRCIDVIVGGPSAEDALRRLVALEPQ